MILAGDIGATHTRLGLFVVARGKLVTVREETFPSGGSASLERIVERFLARGGEKPTRAAIGVAGPVMEGRSEVVNLAWAVDGRRLARRLGLPQVVVLNDLEATAWGIGELPRRGLADLTPRVRARPGNAALIAAGTGLGTAVLAWDGRRHRPAPAEGGHQAFAPRDEEEIGLLREGLRRWGRLSLDRIVCGAGLLEIYRFLSGDRGAMPRPPAVPGPDDPNAAVADAGLRGSDPIAERAVERFLSLYGAAAGDLALAVGAVGGIYVGGGIAPKLLPKIRDGAFLEAFRSKGRLTAYMERIPVRILLEPRAALLGAAARAARGFPRPLPYAPRGRTEVSR